MIKVQLVQCC